MISDWVHQLVRYEIQTPHDPRPLGSGGMAYEFHTKLADNPNQIGLSFSLRFIIT